jgi:serine/threonine-protein kinase
MYSALPEFGSAEEELRFLRGLVALQRLSDEILEDCLERKLGLSSAVDVFLSSCARMIHAQGGFVQIRGSREPVLTRVSGKEPIDLERYASHQGAVPVDKRHTLFVTQLTLGTTAFGAIGFLLQGSFDDGGKQVMSLVEAVGEMLDSAVLGFLALAEGGTPLGRLDELNEAAAFRPKTRIGRYELVTPLGTGGMAQVMVAKTLGPSGVSRLVAIKRILPHLTSDPVMVAQFLDEARIGMRLTHPNLVTVYDFGQAVGGGYYIAMELLRGVDFDRVIYGAGAANLEPKLAVAVVLQALAGLHAAHELKGEDGAPLGLVHRDLSPHNVMVGFDGRVKLLDFGVAKVRNQKTVTLPGIVKGKPLYMSPEQAVGERVDRRSDLFSIGLMLYEALVGARCYVREDDTKTMEAIVRDPLPPRPSVIAPPLWDVLKRALEKAPEDRYRTAAEMADALREVAPPATDTEVARYLAFRFATQAADAAHWEKLAALPSSPVQG